MKRLSIVTISFNQGKYLRQCLESVLSQKTDQVEYIVVDPGSTDGSREILNAYRSGIDHLVLEKDDGPADGLNKGFARACGDIGYFLNSDDLLLPGAIPRMLTFWDSRPGIDVALGEAWLIDGQGRPLRRLRPALVTPERLLDGRATPVQQGISFRMEAFRAVGGFRVENRSCWDTELLFDLSLAQKSFELQRERLGAFRLYDASLTGGVAGHAHQQRLLEDFARMAARLPPNRRPLPPRLARVAKHARNPFFLAERLRMAARPSLIRAAWDRDLGKALMHDT